MSKRTHSAGTDSEGNLYYRDDDIEEWQLSTKYRKVADAVDAADVTIDPSGLSVVTTTDVQAAVGELDAASGTSTLWVPASSFVAHAGSPAIDQSFGNGFPAHLMDAATDEQVSGSFVVPSSWSTMDLTIVWANASTGSGDVRWRSVYTPNDVGDGMTTGAVAPAAVVSTAGSQFVRVDATLASGVSVTKELWGVRVWRDADDAADTLANDAAFVGLLVQRAS